jgi:hypothetical protein
MDGERWMKTPVFTIIRMVYINALSKWAGPGREESIIWRRWHRQNVSGCEAIDGVGRFGDRVQNVAPAIVINHNHIHRRLTAMRL